MKTEITITLDQLATMMATCWTEFSFEKRRETFSTFRWILYCVESEETAEAFYERALTLCDEKLHELE